MGGLTRTRLVLKSPMEAHYLLRQLKKEKKRSSDGISLQGWTVSFTEDMGY